MNKSDEMFFVCAWVVFFATYISFSLGVRKKGTGNFAKRKVNLSGIVLQSGRIKRVPGLYSALPTDPKRLKVLAILLLLAGLLPLVVPLFSSQIFLALIPSADYTYESRNIGSASKFEQEESSLERSAKYSDVESQQDSIARILALCFIAFTWLMSRIFAAGWALLILPKECGKCGWDIANWLSISKRIPTEIGFTARNLPLKGGSKSYAWMVLSYAIYYFALTFCTLIFLTVIGGGLGTVVCFFAFRKLQKLAISMRRKGVQTAIADTYLDDVLSPSVYLRAFYGDEKLSSTESTIGRLSLEEKVILALLSGGRRVVALGRPGEVIPPLGAERFYVPDREWQHVIHRWLESSYCIAMVASDTEATGWEIEEVFRTNSQDKFIIVFFDKPAKTNEFAIASLWRKERKEVEQVVTERLGEVGVFEIPLLVEGEVLLAIAFLKNKRPMIITADKRNTDGVEEALKCHLDRLGMPEIQDYREQEKSSKLLWFVSIAAFFSVVMAICLSLCITVLASTAITIAKTFIFSTSVFSVCSGQASVTMPFLSKVAEIRPLASHALVLVDKNVIASIVFSLYLNRPELNSKEIAELNAIQILKDANFSSPAYSTMMLANGVWDEYIYSTKNSFTRLHCRVKHLEQGYACISFLDGSPLDVMKEPMYEKIMESFAAKGSDWRNAVKLSCDSLAPVAVCNYAATICVPDGTKVQQLDEITTALTINNTDNVQILNMSVVVFESDLSDDQIADKYSKLIASKLKLSATYNERYKEEIGGRHWNTFSYHLLTMPMTMRISRKGRKIFIINFVQLPDCLQNSVSLQKQFVESFTPAK